MTCQVYATIPVVNMGKMCMYDMYQSKTNEIEFKTFTLEDVDNAFDKITPVRYSQPISLTGRHAAGSRRRLATDTVLQANARESPSQHTQQHTPLVVQFGRSSKIPRKLSMPWISIIEKNSKDYRMCLLQR